MKKLALIVAMLMVLGMVTMSQATLIDRGADTLGYRFIYDTDLDITWLQGTGLGGQMSWSSANTWAANFTDYDSVHNVYYDDWRLPTSLNQDGSGPCTGWNCTGSEMGHLFYTELGNTGSNAPPWSLNNKGLLTNLNWGAYWSSTAGSSGLAWSFQFHSGWQDSAYGQGNTLSFLVVRNGNVVPEPATMLLLGLGLMGLAAVRRKFNK